jgi:hypothetical protein
MGKHLPGTLASESRRAVPAYIPGTQTLAMRLDEDLAIMNFKLEVGGTGSLSLSRDRDFDSDSLADAGPGRRKY